MSHRDRQGVNDQIRTTSESIDACERDGTLGKAPACRGTINRSWSTFDPRFDVRAAWTQFLDRWTWDWLASLTFEYDTHPEAANKLFRVWIDRVNKHVYGKRYANRTSGVHWIKATEYQKRGTIHFHSLLGADKNLNLVASRQHCRQAWDDMVGYARLDRIRANPQAAINYVVKYVAKEQDLELSSDLGHYVRQLPLDAATDE